MNVQLDIERLILDGLDVAPPQRRSLQAAFEAELTRLVKQHGLMADTLPGGAASVPAVVGKNISWAVGQDAAQLGRQIAHSVYFGLGGDETRPLSTARHLSPEVSEALQAPGQPLPATTRAFMESRFGRDLSRVRVHTGERAARSARKAQARAYTIGHDVVFGSGQYDPQSDAGRALLAHELTHVVQQNFGDGRIDWAVEGQSSYAQEQEAASISRTIVNGSTVITPRITRTSTLRLAADKNPPGWDAMHNYKHPGNVTARLTIFKTTGMTKDFSARYIEVTKKMLKEHGLSLDVYIHPTKLDWTLPLQTIEQVLELRMLGHKAFQDTTPRLPIFFAPMHYSTHTTGQTFSKTDWLPFVVINSEEESNDGVTLLHEMGHAASIVKDVDVAVRPADAVNNFMLYGNGRNDMHKDQVIALAKAYFSG